MDRLVCGDVGFGKTEVALRAAYVAGTATAAGYPIPRWWLLAVVFYGFASSAVHVLRSLIGQVATARSDQNRV